MTVAAAFLLGAIVGWTLYASVVKYSIRLVGRDQGSRLKMLDSLSFSALTKLRDAANQEINRRKGTP